MNKEIIEKLNSIDNLEIIQKNIITQDVIKYYYENKEGVKTFGGNFLKESDTFDFKNKLNGTTTIIGYLFPYGDMINPIANLWLSKLERRDSKNKNKNDFLFDDFSSEYSEAIKGLNKANALVSTELSKITSDGNYSEVITLHLLQNNGNLKGYENTVAREIEKEKMNLFRSEKAIKFGELAYKEIIKLGKKVELVDYQTIAADKVLHDIGFFDFVLKVDGKLYLIDMKTGSRVKDSKLEKVKLQLLGSYKTKFKGVFGQYPDKVLVISAVEDEVKVGQIKSFQTFGETIDITDCDKDSKYLNAYESTAKWVHQMQNIGIFKRNKKENIVFF